MTRPVCLRALTAVPWVIGGLVSISASAEQSEPAPVSKQADTKPTSTTQNVALGGGKDTQIKTVALSAPGQQGDQGMQKTPAQQKYGLPRNPMIGGPVDLDLSKPLSLNRATQIALARQNSIAISKTQVDSANARLDQSRSSYYPQIAPSLQYQTIRNPTGNSSSYFETRNASISLRQTIYDTGRRESNVGISRRNVFSAEYGLGNQRQSVILSIAEDYYSLLRNRELVKVQEESLRRAQTTLESIQARVEAKDAAAVDVLQAEADVANAKVALLQAQNVYNLSVASLKNSMGVVTAQALKLTGDEVKPPDPTPDSRTYEYYVNLAYENRLDLKQQQEQINAQGYSVRLAQINNGVTVDASVSEGYAVTSPVGEDRTFVVSISYPLFDGGNTRAGVRASKAGLEAERRSLDQLQQGIRLNVEQSYLDKEQARQRYVAAASAATASKANYEAAQERLRRGAVNILDVLNAEVQYVNAQVSLVQAVYDFYIADARLLRDTGLNDPSYVPNVPGAKPPRAVPTTSTNSPSPVALNTPTMPASGLKTTALDAGGRKP